MNISPAIVERCRNLFLNCSEFDSYENLRAVFVTDELRPFRVGIKQADSSAGLVDLFLDFIREQKLTGGKPVFPVFLYTLRAKYGEGDARRDELTQLIQEIQLQEQPANMTVPSLALQHQLLHEKLLTLDFRPQVRRFKEVIEQYRVAAFLVHGPPAHGQRFLTHRLAQFRKEWEIGQRIIIDAGSSGIGKSAHTLWRQVARQMQLPHDTSKEILAEKVCEWWKTQDVIFVFYTVDYIPPHILAAWIDEFWRPISTTAREKQHLTQTNTHLLLFLVDFDGHVCETQVTLLDQPDQIITSHAPLKLPPTGKFPEAELEIWIDNAAELLPSRVDAVELISATENGVPELVYEKICECCGLSWEGDMMP
jgi:hypothetical protein